MEKKSTSKAVVALLVVLIVAVLGVGGYFIIKDINSKNDTGGSSPSSSSDAGGSSSGSGSSSSDTGGGSSSGGSSGSSTNPATTEIEAGITYAEVRGNDYYIEAQTNGVIYGTCDISMVPTDGSQGHHDTDDLEPHGSVSTCDEDFSLKGLNPGEHKITVVIRANDGRTKTLEKIVKI